MTRKVRILFICCLLFASALSCLAACGQSADNDAAKIVVEGESFTAEFNETFTVPSAYLVDRNDKRVDGKVDIVVVNPKNIIVATSAIELKAKVAGDYTVTYSYGNLETQIKITSKDTIGPTLTLKNTFSDMYVGHKVIIPNLEMRDVSDIDNDSGVFKVYRLDGDARIEYDIEPLTNSVTPDTAGTYVYHAEISDKAGNKTVSEWKFTVVDKTWLDGDATGATIASFDKAEYVNVFGAGTATDRQGNPDFEILDEFQNEKGVAKVTMNYFDHNFGNYSSVNIRFPRDYRYTAGKRVAIKVYLENTTFESNFIHLMQYEHTHVTGVGVSILANYGVRVGTWQTIIIENNVLSSLKASGSDAVLGLQLDIKRDSKATDATEQVIYIASITEIETLTAPSNLRAENNLLKWDKVNGAIGYAVRMNDELITVEENYCSLPDGAYTACVKALGDNAYYEDSGFGAKIGNMLDAPANVTMDDNDVVSWDAVRNAKGYVVEINGVEHEVADTNYAFTEQKDADYIIKVKAKGDGEVYYDSDYSVIVERFTAPTDGVIADFGDDSYVYDVKMPTALNLAGYAPESLEVEYLNEYEGANGVLKITMVPTSNTWAVATLKLPHTLFLDDTLVSLSIRFRIEGLEGGTYKGLRVYGHATDNNGRDLDPAETYALNGIGSWYTAVIDKAAIAAGFNGSPSSDYISFGVALAPAGVEFSIYLDSITYERTETAAAAANANSAERQTELAAEITEIKFIEERRRIESAFDAIFDKRIDFLR